MNNTWIFCIRYTSISLFFAGNMLQARTFTVKWYRSVSFQSSVVSKRSMLQTYKMMFKNATMTYLILHEVETHESHVSSQDFFEAIHVEMPQQSIPLWLMRCAKRSARKGYHRSKRMAA